MWNGLYMYSHKKKHTTTFCREGNFLIISLASETVNQFHGISNNKYWHLEKCFPKTIKGRFLQDIQSYTECTNAVFSPFENRPHTVKQGFPNYGLSSTFLMYFEKFVLRYFSIFCFQFPTKAKYSSKNSLSLIYLVKRFTDIFWYFRTT